MTSIAPWPSQAGWASRFRDTAVGRGINDAALMLYTISATGVGLSGASSVHMNIARLRPVGQ